MKARSDTPVILLTGWGQRLMEDDDIPANVDRVLSKPPKLYQLRAALSELVPGCSAHINQNQVHHVPQPDHVT